MTSIYHDKKRKSEKDLSLQKWLMLRSAYLTVNPTYSNSTRTTQADISLTKYLLRHQQVVFLRHRYLVGWLGILAQLVSQPT